LEGGRNGCDGGCGGREIIEERGAITLTMKRGTIKRSRLNEESGGREKSKECDPAMGSICRRQEILPLNDVTGRCVTRGMGEQREEPKEPGGETIS